MGLFDFDELLAELTPMMHQSLGGETFALHRSNTLESVKGGTTPKAMEAAAPALAGAVEVSLRLPGAATMKGAILEGAVLSIAGQEYSVTADAAIPPLTTAVLLAVPIAPALAAPLAEGAPVQIVSGPVFTFEDVLLVSAGRHEENQTDTGAEIIMEISIPVRDAPTAPKNGDGVERAKDGTTGRISGVPVIVGGSWEVKVGAP